MIQILATKYRGRVAFSLFLLFDMFFFLSAGAMKSGPGRIERSKYVVAPLYSAPAGLKSIDGAAGNLVTEDTEKRSAEARALSTSRADIGGPNQPEMTSFKPADMKNMVNLFTGDFSYNIPLLDVGGYPVNLFYSGEVTPEQDASWVGLGWNINPGNVNRNLRGVPDDFNGSEKLTQQQYMKPNTTFGVGIGGDAEFMGFKKLPPTLTLNTGVSWNSYLGMALDLGVKGGVTFKVVGKSGSEKSPAMNLGLDVSLDLNSRSGLTIAPSASLTGNAFLNDTRFNAGTTASTSYNSRVGVRSLQITDQVSITKISERIKHEAAYDIITHTVNKFGENLYGTSISFARPSYIPSIRSPLKNTTIGGQFQLGSGIYGVYASADAEVYQQVSEIDPSKVTQKKPMVGYLYSENASTDANMVMDFSRQNDREVTPNTPIISAPQYAYDVFSIQGEGSGGTIRAYRNDPGTVRDNFTGSTDDNDGLGVDIGPPGHFGGNRNRIWTPSTIGDWRSHNGLLGQITFQGRHSNTSLENLYFRNPGETSVLDAHEYDGIGGTNLVRFQLDVAAGTRDVGIKSTLDKFSSTGALTGTVAASARTDAFPRKKRTQMVDFLTASDASAFGLDKAIKSYNSQTFLDPVSDTLLYSSIPRVDNNQIVRRANHISEIDVTETDGRRYIYGVPVYNLTQSDLTFTVNGNDRFPGVKDQVKYTDNEADPTKTVQIAQEVNDGYAQVTTTPAYAHSFLLSGLLSPDYVDLTGDGITDDDLGNAVKFNYSLMADAHLWRTPIGDHFANFNPGSWSNGKDDKGLVSYGSRESWYLHSIESKSMIAIFTLQDRFDGQSVNTDGSLASGNHSLKCLSKIELFNKADLKKNGYGTASTNAKAIKTVNFTYDYSLCQNTPDHPGSGKLTLTSITFSYNSQSGRTNKDHYDFSYGSGAGDNPPYAVNASDRWGVYKPASQNPGGMLNSVYPYTPQQVSDGEGGMVSAKTVVGVNAGAWSLKKILLPSGGQIDVTYESDDYAYVQNRRAMEMMSIAGFGQNSTTITNELYRSNPLPNSEHLFVFINVPQPCANDQAVYDNYLDGVDQLAVRMMVNMPFGKEYITSYAQFSPTPGNYGVSTTNPKIIWVKMTPVDGKSPLSLSALEYLREQLPAQAFPGYDLSHVSGLEAVGDALAGMIDAISSAFTDPIDHFRSEGKARFVQVDQSFVRLNDPLGYKLGGGQRVKSLKLTDNWDQMSHTFKTTYDQEYNYETTETFHGAIRTISSGVASYEPGTGSEENPFHSIFLVSDKVPLGPTSYGSVEMPVLESLFPAPMVGYSKVTVTSVPSDGNVANRPSRSGIGRQVTEFYTTKDFPVIYSHTSLDPATDVQAHDASTLKFLTKYSFDSRALSQGFLVVNNDMNGKLRSQSSYAENDPTLRVNYTQNFYRNTGVNGLNETFDFVSAANGGVISPGNLGIDVELMTDTREFKVSGHSKDEQLNVEEFPIGIDFWIPMKWDVYGTSETLYRAVTTTKVVTYHSVLDSVLVIDKGSKVGTKNLLYDAETGRVIVTRTNNEFEQPVYQTTYPAWWAYSGMGPAYRNTEMSWTGLSISDGKVVAGTFDANVLESGDELFYAGLLPAGSCPPGSKATGRLWVLDKNKNNPPFPASSHDYIFIDSLGRPFTNTNTNPGQASYRIIRSGKRNMLDATLATATSLVNPIKTTDGVGTLFLDGSSMVLNATALEFSEKWQMDRDAIGTFRTEYDPSICGTKEVPDCNGHLEPGTNPYRRGLLGNFRPSRTMTFYDKRLNSDVGTHTILSKDGALANFLLYWGFNSSNVMVPNTTATNWIESNRLTRVNARGMELETKNALGIYTAALYGFNKTLPSAVVNNAAYHQVEYEGFEENGYSSFLSAHTDMYCPNQQHLDLYSMNHGHVLNTDGMQIAAHTGKYVLGVDANSTATQAIPVIQDPTNYDYQFTYGTAQAPQLTDPGGTVTSLSVNPGYAGFPNPQTYVINQTTFANGGFQTTSLALANSQVPVSPQGNQTVTLSHGFTVHYTYYINVVSTGTYHFGLTMTGAAGSLPNDNDDCNMRLSLYDLDGNKVNSDAGVSSHPSSGDINTVLTWQICSGLYQVVVDATDNFSKSGLPPNSSLSTSYIIKMTTDAASTNYNSFTRNGCTYGIAAPETDNMLNPIFSLSAGKKMLVSAWVHEDPCGIATTGGICNPAAYTNSKITINGGGSDVNLTPAGPIIEGWQRFEGTIDVPIGGTSGYISFTNTSANTIYFDDVRIHPFNAEMKSYVYDPVSLRLVSELDANNYATYYEYDEEGTLIRVKAETQRGIKTLKESRSAKQRGINIQ